MVGELTHDRGLPVGPAPDDIESNDVGEAMSTNPLPQKVMAGTSPAMTVGVDRSLATARLMQPRPAWSADLPGGLGDAALDRLGSLGGDLLGERRELLGLRRGSLELLARMRG
jgi:hypothetical protein